MLKISIENKLLQKDVFLRILLQLSKVNILGICYGQYDKSGD